MAFIAGACTLIPVNDYNLLRPHGQQPRLSYHHITCRKCSTNALADEAHVLLHCPCTDACRRAFQGLCTPGGTLRAFLSAHHAHPHAPFFVYTCIQTYTKAQVVANAAPVQAHTPDPRVQPASDHTDADSVASNHTELDSLSASQYDVPSDTDSHASLDSISHIPRRTEHLTIMQRVTRLRRRAILD